MIFDSLLDLFKADGRRFLVPEVVQTSSMDCGPAALKALLEGFGISVNYARLREACQTDVDGTSIDTVEEVALQLGLNVQQAMVPVDHLFIAGGEAMPAIVVVRQPSGLTHFVLAWSQISNLVQVMDPATGRRWPTQKRFLDEIYVHTMPVSAKMWREWAGTVGFCDPLRQRMQVLELPQTQIEYLFEQALADPSWQSLAILDAATRMVTSIVDGRGLVPGTEAGDVLAAFFHHVRERLGDVSATEDNQPTEPPSEQRFIPAPYWSVQPLPPEVSQAQGEETILFHGAVLVQVISRKAAPGEVDEDEAAEPLTRSPALTAALEEETIRPERTILHYLQADGLLTPFILVVALGVASLSVMIEALLLRGILDVGVALNSTGQRIGVAVMVFLFMGLLFLLDWPLGSLALRIGRRLETRLRIAFLEKIPRLSDRYFHSRLTSDMIQRAHDLRQLRGLPNLGVSFIRLVFQIILTMFGVIWFEPGSFLLAALATLVGVGMSFVSQPLLIERDMRLQSHIGAMSHFYLDALLGLIPIRSHSAERAVLREHEGLLVEWFRAGLAFGQVQRTIQTLGAAIGAGFSVWILFNYIAQGGEASGILLLFYWTLSLPALGQAMAGLAQQYPLQRNRVMRLLEPLSAPDEGAAPTPEPVEEIDGPQPIAPSNSDPAADRLGGVRIDIQRATVRAGGQTILDDVDLQLERGEHIAVVGPSGAGKSSLVGLLLGWHHPAQGRVLVDGGLLSGDRLSALRRQTAWVDPAVQLWNRTLLENLRYGSGAEGTRPLNTVVEQADLYDVLTRLPDEYQTILGEGGGLLSGGEGQRVRLGRGMLRSAARLVILDEPFRGLDRAQRRELLQRARAFWAEATLIFISHDISQTQTFERVVVIDAGRIVEDGTPQALLTQAASRYQSMLAAETAVRRTLWEHTDWRRLWLVDGQLQEGMEPR